MKLDKIQRKKLVEKLKRDWLEADAKRMLVRKQRPDVKNQHWCRIRGEKLEENVFWRTWQEAIEAEAARNGIALEEIIENPWVRKHHTSAASAEETAGHGPSEKKALDQGWEKRLKAAWDAWDK